MIEYLIKTQVSTSMDSPVARLSRLKRSPNCVQAQRLEYASILSLDAELIANQKSMNDYKTKAGFFSILTHDASTMNQCAPGSILPSIPVPSFVGLATKKTFNATHRVVGYETSPMEPWNNLSKNRYMRNKHQKHKAEHSRSKTKTRYMARSPSPNKEQQYFSALNINTSMKSNTSSQGGEMALLNDILKMHQHSVKQNARKKNRTARAGGTGNVLYDQAVKLEKQERKAKLIEAMINDADQSIALVINRTTR